MSTSTEVKEYYDDFTQYEIKQGLNLRHYHVFNRIIESGLRPEHNVLEIGCGIGQITYLLAKYLTKGKIVATDISPKSIALAQKRIGNNSRTSFYVTDMTDFQYAATFDFVILPDVLEHIPEQQHATLFQHLAAMMHKKSIMLIHIPHPDNINYDRQYRPAKLQIIDQALSPAMVIQHAENAGLHLLTFAPYALYHKEHDYIFILFSNSPILKYHNISKIEIIKKKLLARIKLIAAKLLV